MNKKGSVFFWVIILLIALILIFYFYGNQINGMFRAYQDTSNLPENKQPCPGLYNPGGSSILLFKENLNSSEIVKMTLRNLVDQSIWKIESDPTQCYKGKYSGQKPNWIYCDNMVVSRWELGDSGEIKYRWYTTANAEWKPVITNSSSYVSDALYELNGFSCEDGQVVTIQKGKHQVYIHDSRDGTSINVAISEDETPVNIEY